jgi:hypothetical protein
VPESQVDLRPSSADDFTSLFGEGMLESFGGSQMSIEELLSGAVSGPSQPDDSGTSGKPPIQES